jgi:hypothetical protein
MMSSQRKSDRNSASPSDERAPERAPGDAPADGDVSEGDRRTSERRVISVERRAFWRPTPDRRREDTELGRRKSDR